MNRDSQVPTVIGGGASAESRSIIPTGNYFDAALWRSCCVVSALRVVCPKKKHRAQGSRDFSCHHLAATAALAEIFGAAKHFCTQNANGELFYKYKDIRRNCAKLPKNNEYDTLKIRTK
jgi:hypothetical protein